MSRRQEEIRDLDCCVVGRAADDSKNQEMKGLYLSKQVSRILMHIIRPWIRSAVYTEHELKKVTLDGHINELLNYEFHLSGNTTLKELEPSCRVRVKDCEDVIATNGLCPSAEKGILRLLHLVSQ